MKSGAFKRCIYLGLLSLGLSACMSEQESPVVGGCIEARLIDHICGEAVIQIVSPAFTRLGEDGWTDGQGNEYDHVFFTYIDCEDEDKLPTDGTSFYITITEAPANQTCVVCDATLSNRPDKRLNIRLIGVCAYTLG